jgi:hypothetical protein
MQADPLGRTVVDMIVNPAEAAKNLRTLADTRVHAHADVKDAFNFTMTALGVGDPESSYGRAMRQLANEYAVLERDAERLVKSWKQRDAIPPVGCLALSEDGTLLREKIVLTSLCFSARLPAAQRSEMNRAPMVEAAKM